MTEDTGAEDAAGVEGLRVAEVAERAGVSRWTINRWVKNGRMAVWYRTPGGSPRFDPRTVDGQLRLPP